MIEKIYLVTDLGPGDGGKGGVVHKLANIFHADVILKFGGGQGSHGIVTDGGEKFPFSHWGCGTLEAIPTAIAPSFIAIPHAILNEGQALQRMGLNNPYALLSIDPCTLCATPFHKIASQLSELYRKDAPRGTVGTGAGEAYRLERKFSGGLSLRVRDLGNAAKVRQVLEKIISYYQNKFANLSLAKDFLTADQDAANELLDLLHDPRYVEWTLEQYARLMSCGITLRMFDEILQQCSGIAIAECSHGVLTDAEYGFKPHVSAIRTLPQFPLETLSNAGYTGKVVRLGVTRAYAIRHGAGPLPTADSELRGRLLPGSHKDTNRWQGEVRVGAVDFKLLRHAINLCGGSTAFDGICVTCFDQILKDNVWEICDSYTAECPICNDAICDCLNCKNLLSCIKDERINPNITTIHNSQHEMMQKCCEVFYQQLGVPVRLISLGPSDQDKILL